MSIDRSSDKPPANDGHVHHRCHRKVDPDSADPPSQADRTSTTQAVLTTELSKTIVDWVDSLPVDVRPRELTQRFPRIARVLCALWNEPQSFNQYMDALLHGRRASDRQAFPEKVLRELLVLRDYYATLHPPAVGAKSVTTTGSKRPE